MIGNIYVNLEVSINLENLHSAPNTRLVHPENISLYFQFYNIIILKYKQNIKFILTFEGVGKTLWPNIYGPFINEGESEKIINLYII